ncbi:alpha/beta hydrolase [Nocardia asteroides NBRC 15531]|uniref:alpha/beta fold hydrolase n=1 Tax=Nocardia asteroides TaxID=1824 RepID=UPI0008E9FA49|nr:alpha/beta hydrolase [Nocardia asteroides]TLF61939.1 alpha/beta hydrolase [Nocardia asteroides NBRC 15531]SFN86006.1 4,5:9,10-diseco-3-hydroxy-5,9,17-trioxoandrosta-1(10),2-diene-4-oate hydrolase [Nocardia asteroides]VEG34529.1 2-hydroxy-6-oxononadienedioate/2-hydroxy-6-oxononatrienedioate hydrolase [Nocardia asteroides]
MRWSTGGRRRSRAVVAVLAAAVWLTAVPAAAEAPGAAEQALGPARYVDTPLARFHYRQLGAGSPVVFLPGGTVWSYTWREIAPAVAAGHTVVTVDPPGYGYTTPTDPAFGFDLTSTTDAIVQFLDAAGIERASFVAHSMGGALAVALAARYPERVDRLVLAAPLVLDRDLNPALRLVRVPGVGQAAAELMTEPVFTTGLRNSYAHPERLTPEVAAAYWDAASRPVNRAAMWRASGLDLAAVTALLPRVAAPTLLVWGSGDTWIPVEQSTEVLAQLPSARRALVPDAAHMVHEDNPGGFRAAIGDFLD